MVTHNFCDYRTSHFSTLTRLVFKKLLNLQAFYFARPNTPEHILCPDGFVLCTNDHCSRLWNVPVRSLERALRTLRREGYIETCRRGERARRYIRLLPPSQKTLERQLSFDFDAPHPALTATVSVSTPVAVQYVYTGSGTCTPLGYFTGGTENGFGGTESSFGGTVAGLHLINNTTSASILPSLSPSEKRTAGQREKPVLKMEKDYSSIDPVLEKLNSHSPFQTEEQGRLEMAHCVRIWRLKHLRLIEDANGKTLKDIFRRHRKEYDREKRALASDFFGFYGEHLMNYYRFLDKACEYLISTCGDVSHPGLIAWCDEFMLTVRLNQKTFTVPYLYNNFGELLEMNRQIALRQEEKETGIKRSGYEYLDRIGDVFQDLERYQATFDKYTEMRRKARLKLDTATHTWDGRNATLLLHALDNVARESWKYIVKQPDQKVALQEMFVLMLQKWQHYPRWSPFIFAQRWEEVMAVIREVKSKSKQNG